MGGICGSRSFIGLVDDRQKFEVEERESRRRARFTIYDIRYTERRTELSPRQARTRRTWYLQQLATRSVSFVNRN